MTQELYYAVFNTPAGWMGILGSEAGLVGVTLPHSTPEAIPRQLGINQDVILSPQRFQSLIERLMSYFAGHKVDFPDKLDLSKATGFQRRVWEKTRLIPYGETRSYSWVARQLEKSLAARPVGQALGRNPLSIIVPCHRVLTSDGTLGGFTGGLEMKKYLLRLEKSPGNRR